MSDTNELDGLGLSPRARNILRYDGYTTIAEIRAAGPNKIICAPNCGRKTIREIGQAIGGWGEQTEIDKAQVEYDKLKRRYVQLHQQLSQAKAKLNALKNPPPVLLTIDDIVQGFRARLDRHCTGYITNDVLRIVVSTRNANWVELEADISSNDWERPHWSLMTLDRLFMTYLTAALADVSRRIDEIEEMGAAGNASPGHWRRLPAGYSVKTAVPSQ